MPLKGTAALMSHCISFIWSSLERVDGWNRCRIHSSRGLIGARGHGDRGRDGDQRKRAGIIKIRVLEGPLIFLDVACWFLRCSDRRFQARVIPDLLFFAHLDRAEK